MGADVRRPITVTTLAYRGSAEEPLLPAHAAQTVISTGLSSSTRSSACNVDDSMYAANDDRKGSTVTEDVEGEDWEEDTAARQAAAVAPDDHEVLHLAPPLKRPRSDPTPQTPRQPRQGATGSSSVADGSTVAASVPVPSSRTLSALQVGFSDPRVLWGRVLASNLNSGHKASAIIGMRRDLWHYSGIRVA
jgi:hypothetical protein